MKGGVELELRKVFVVGNSLAVSLPRKLLRVLRCGPTDYVEVFLADQKTLVIRKHINPEGRRKNV
jgi:antitoxin component of MazEF toxin-antitoxin module